MIENGCLIGAKLPLFLLADNFEPDRTAFCGMPPSAIVRVLPKLGLRNITCLVEINLSLDFAEDRLLVVIQIAAYSRGTEIILHLADAVKFFFLELLSGVPVLWDFLSLGIPLRRDTQ